MDRSDNVSILPTILVLDDERPQLNALRVTLGRMGHVKEFNDPHSALKFLERNRVEVAVVDVHMPRFDINGIEFIRRLRAFDRELSVIVRTADDSSVIADQSIEQRAFRRAVKHKTLPSALQQMVSEAVAETLGRRKLARDAANSAAVKSELVAVIGTAEDERFVSDSCRAATHELRNQLTALDGLAEVLEAGLEHHPILRAQAVQNRAIVRRAISALNRFSDDPMTARLGSPAQSACARVNGVLETIRQRCQSDPKFAISGITLKTRTLLDDLYVSAPPLKLITALRHVLEFMIARHDEGTSLTLSATVITETRVHCGGVNIDRFVTTMKADAISAPYVSFGLKAAQSAISIHEVRKALEDEPLKMRNGNLQMVELALAGYEAELAVTKLLAGDVEFTLNVPIAC